MKKIDFKILFFTSIVCLLPILIGLIHYDILPEMVAIHFNINNVPDNFWPKEVFVFGMPVLMFVMQVFLCLTVDLADKRKDANKKMSLVSKWICPIITLILYLVTISYALGNAIDIRAIVMWLVGLMFIIIGNYLPKTKGGYYIRLGKKFVYEEETFQKISKYMGYILIIDGFLAIISTFLAPAFSVMIILLIILESLILSTYSYKVGTKKE